MEGLPTAPVANANMAANYSSGGSGNGSDAGASSSSAAAVLPSLSSQLRAIFEENGQWRPNGTAGVLHFLRRRIATLRSPSSDSGAQSSSSTGFGGTAAERAAMCAQLEEVMALWAAQNSDIRGWDIIETDFDAEGSGLSEQEFQEALAVAAAGEHATTAAQ